MCVDFVDLFTGCVRCWLFVIHLYWCSLYFVECSWFCLFLLMVVFDVGCVLLGSVGFRCIWLNCINCVWLSYWLCSCVDVFSFMLMFVVVCWMVLYVVDFVYLFNGCESDFVICCCSLYVVWNVVDVSLVCYFCWRLCSI